MYDQASYLKLISDIIRKYNLEYLMIIDSLKTEKLEVFLAGLPKTGKTTFLNAMLGLSRNELYESTKKATKCIFKISYGDEYCYRRNGEEIKPMPKSLEAKKELLVFINNSDQVTELFLPVDILDKINIYDVPGLFSGDNTDDNIEYLIKSSDLLLLLKNGDELCTPDEAKFIDMSLSNGSNYLILFSLGDMLNKEIKNNPVEFKKYFSNKISEYPASPDYFLISSEDFYRNKEKGNILNVINYIINNSEKFKLASINKKINISSREYRDILVKKLSEAKNIIENEKSNLTDLYKIKLSREDLHKEDEINEFKFTMDNYCDHMISDIRNQLNSDHKTYNDFEVIWNKYYELSYLFAQTSINKDIEKNIPNLPKFDEIILSSYDFETILKKLNHITKKVNNDKELEYLLDQLKKVSEQLNESDIVESKKVNIEDSIEKILENILKLSKDIDYTKVLDELLNYVIYRKAVTLFYDNCQTSYNSINENYINLFKEKIYGDTMDIEKQKDKDITNLENKLKDELNIDELNSDIIKLQEYINES